MKGSANSCTLPALQVPVPTPKALPHFISRKEEHSGDLLVHEVPEQQSCTALARFVMRSKHRVQIHCSGTKVGAPKYSEQLHNIQELQIGPANRLGENLRLEVAACAHPRSNSSRLMCVTSFPFVCVTPSAQANNLICCFLSALKPYTGAHHTL